MPNSLLSEALQEAYASCPVDTVILETLEFRHPSFIDDQGQPTAIRVVKDWRDWTAKLEASAPLNPGQFVTFIGYAFRYDPPSMEDNRPPEVEITIDNVAAGILFYIDQAISTPDIIKMTYRPYLSTDVDAQGRLNQPHMNPPLHFDVTSIEANVMTITARAKFGDFTNMKFPSEDYTATRFPGLFR